MFAYNKHFNIKVIFRFKQNKNEIYCQNMKKKSITTISIVKNCMIYVDEFNVFDNQNNNVNKREIEKINFV